ncbi:MAG: hypothetical protein DI585_01280 [Pseudomonas fluorescens]|nr:MAG: hypothetical protein DI585_01280 [Pseudomonas fluorescens]
MFSAHLFNHKYDIDDIISALCGTAAQWLNTQNGTLSATEPTEAPESHRFLIEPLPASCLKEIANSSEQLHLSEDDKVALSHILSSATVQSLPQHFAQGRIGGWLRERIKDTALEWLDTHDLIPPSMRHINRAKAAKLYATRTIKIEDIN